MATIFRPSIIVTISPRQKAKEDWSINLRVLYAPNPAVPFNQLDWPLAARAKAKATGEATGLSPLYAPVVAVPFNQINWPLGAAPRKPVPVDIFVNLLPLQAAPNVLPFSLTDWSTVARPRFRANVDLIERSAPLYTPNPDRPFINPIIANLNAPKRPGAIVDAFVNLLPVQNPPPPVGHVFEWLTRARRRGRR